MRDIRAFASRIAAEFKPQPIILFGSYAHGTPTSDSDVDLMVVVPYRGRAVEAAIAIAERVPFAHPLDLLVRSPAEMAERYELEDWFIRDIIDRGKVLYEAADGRAGRERRRPPRAVRPAFRSE